MLDIKFIRQNTEKVKEGIAKKQVKVDIDRLLELDEKRRKFLQITEDMRAQKNRANEEIKKAKNKEEKEAIILKMRELDKNSGSTASDFQEVDKEFQSLMYLIPNIPDESVPVGKDDGDNVVLRQVGAKTKFNFQPKDYMELAKTLDLIDTERAAKVSGSRFGYLKKEAVFLEFGLVNLALSVLSKEGFSPIVPPVLIKPEMMKAMGYVERGGEEIYCLEKDNLCLVGTAEQAIGPMHSDEIFEEEDLCHRHMAFSSCFRREAGSYGKDTKGILRVHQFDKVEMFSFCLPKDSKSEHELFLSMEENLMRLLKLPYRVVQICTGDLGDPAANKFDIEAWLPGQNQYRETHSTSNCTDFQARRLNIRYRDKSGELKFIHTVNGTAFAIGRIIIAIMENYQRKDGSIEVPKVLQKYIGFKLIKSKR